jgi:hypothetical protein
MLKERLMGGPSLAQAVAGFFQERLDFGGMDVIAGFDKKTQIGGLRR